mmetsp:Transcript_7501/g.21341  ORF Transcript_7501/g.21341 Transcript_7501/m.21341 type:complete len:261 (-) Transcript_7501:378-1160(-)
MDSRLDASVLSSGLTWSFLRRAWSSAMVFLMSTLNTLSTPSRCARASAATVNWYGGNQGGWTDSPGVSLSSVKICRELRGSDEADRLMLPLAAARGTSRTLRFPERVGDRGRTLVTSLANVGFPALPPDRGSAAESMALSFVIPELRRNSAKLLETPGGSLLGSMSCPPSFSHEVRKFCRMASRSPVPDWATPAAGAPTPAVLCARFTLCRAENCSGLIISLSRMLPPREMAVMLLSRRVHKLDSPPLSRSIAESRRPSD